MRHLSILFACMMLLIAGSAFAQWPTGDWHAGSVELGAQRNEFPTASYTNFGFRYLYEDDADVVYPPDYTGDIYTGEYWSSADGPFTAIGYFDIDGLGIPDNSIILEAKLITSTKRNTSDNPSPYPIGVFRVMKPVTFTALGSMTWNKYDGSTAWSSGGASDSQGDWEDVFGGTGNTDYTILSLNNQMDGDWNRTLGAGLDTLLAANVEGTNPIDIAPFPSDITMLVDSIEGTTGLAFKQWIDVTNFFRGIYHYGHENYGFAVKQLDLDISGSGEEGLYQFNNTEREAGKALRTSLFVRYLTIGDGVAAGGGGASVGTNSGGGLN